MRPRKYLYTITDTRDGKVILDHCDNDTARLEIGIPNDKIARYACANLRWRGRYQIAKHEIYKPEPEEKPVIVDKYFSSNDKAFMKGV